MQKRSEKFCRSLKFLSLFLTLSYGYIIAFNTMASPTDNLSKNLEKVATKTMPSIVSIMCASSDKSGGVGTGFFITDTGYILTNFHVIDNSEIILVTTSDGEIYRDVSIVGCDPETDLAVIKIESQKELPSLAFGDSAALLPGQVVCAIGHFNAHRNSITMGIVSAYREQLPVHLMEDLSYINFIQTDVPMCHGNSGGPLLTLDGKCVGINSRGDINMRTGEDSWQGVSYSIDGNFAKRIADRIIRDGFVERSFFGAGGQDLSIGLKAAFNLPENVTGALITNVEKGSPADKGGLKAGDVVTSMGGVNIESAQQLRIEASLSPANKPVSFNILRDNIKKTLSIIPLALQIEEPVEPVIIERMSIMVEPSVNDNHSSSNGLLVVDINVHSPFFYVNAFSELKGAGSAGLSSGERIIKFNNNDLKSIRDLEQAVQKVKPDERVLMLVKDKEGEIRFVTGILP